jgi:hypothetical protein
MTTGQAPIVFKNESNLDTSDTIANVATNQADLAAQSSVDGLDIYPRTVTCEHLFAADGSFSGYLNAGTIYVGSGGVTISSAAEGATPSTGLFLSSSRMTLYKSSVATVDLDGTTGVLTATEFVLTPSATSKFRTAASGARVEMDSTGINVYDTSAVRTLLTTNGLEVRNANGETPGAPEKISFVGHSGVTMEGTLFYAHADHHFYMANYPGGALASYLKLDPTTSEFAQSGQSYLSIGVDTNLVSPGGVVQLTATLGAIGVYSAASYIDLDAATYITLDAPTVTVTAALTAATVAIGDGSVIQSAKIVTGTLSVDGSGQKTVAVTHGMTAPTNVLVALGDYSIVSKCKIDSVRAYVSGTTVVCSVNVSTYVASVDIPVVFLVFKV